MEECEMDEMIPTLMNNDEHTTLHAGDSLYKNILMSSPGMAALIERDTWKVLFVNRSFEYYLGFDSADVEGGDVKFNNLLETYQHDRFFNHVNAVTDSIQARSQYLMYPLKNKNGTTGNYYLYASPVEQEQAGRRLFQVLLFPDLSKWGMPFTSFESKELFLEQFDNEDFGTFERNPGVDKIFWSSGLYRIFEVDKGLKDISTEYAMSFVHPSDRERLTIAAKQALHEGTDLDIELKIIAATKQVKILHCLARCVKDVHGHILLFTGSLRDVTARRVIEEDLKNKVDELHHSNRELEEFAYVASHDMQEPLRKITTFSDRLSEKYKDVLTGDGTMYLNRMNASAENMRNLINDLLDFSRISKSDLAYEHVRLDEVLRQVTTDLELIVEETGTVIHAAMLPAIDAVPSQMKQLLTNIINNAIKFHREDVPPEIVITVEPASVDDISRLELVPNTAYHKISITDNGIGFEDEYANRIFQVFQRLHGKSEYPGSGIGLAICKKILEYHHGCIFAENIPDVGARFTMVIPQNQHA